MPTLLSPKRTLIGYHHLCISPRKRIPRRPSRNFIGLDANRKPYTEAAFIVAGDFNKANLLTSLPKFYQHIDCVTRAGSILDHCYSNFCDAYNPPPAFGKSDHDSILLIPAYRQKLKPETPILRSIQRWSDQSDSTLQDSG